SRAEGFEDSLSQRSRAEGFEDSML
ncbi:hypothetical protein Tco_0659526, partial [Tanacetum coccineum]